MSTVAAKSHTVRRQWQIIDAQDQILGRLATTIAHRLRGKHKPEYTPHVDTGDYIVVVNAANIRVTGRKRTDKNYHYHTGYPGGIRELSFEKLMDKQPTEALLIAVKGMLPKGPLGRAMFKKLKVYAGADHPHGAQQPQLSSIEGAQ